jgi:hypothetical protein
VSTTMELCVKWAGKEYVVSLGADARVSDLKRELAEQTRVQPKRQKVRCPLSVLTYTPNPRTLSLYTGVARLWSTS